MAHGQDHCIPPLPSRTLDAADRTLPRGMSRILPLDSGLLGRLPYPRSRHSRLAWGELSRVDFVIEEG